MAKASKIKQQKATPYKHDVYSCIKKIQAKAIKANPSIEAIEFELSSIKKIFSKSEKCKTGQGVKVYRRTKSGRVSVKKSYVAHVYCPFCGVKF